RNGRPGGVGIQPVYRSGREREASLQPVYRSGRGGADIDQPVHRPDRVQLQVRAPLESARCQEKWEKWCQFGFRRVHPPKDELTPFPFNITIRNYRPKESVLDGSGTNRAAGRALCRQSADRVNRRSETSDGGRAGREVRQDL